MDRSVPQGAPVAASEQLQPVYETKTLVQQNRQLLQSIESHLQVRQLGGEGREEGRRGRGGGEGRGGEGRGGEGRGGEGRGGEGRGEGRGGEGCLSADVSRENPFSLDTCRVLFSLILSPLSGWEGPICQGGRGLGTRLEYLYM